MFKLSRSEAPMPHYSGSSYDEAVNKLYCSSSDQHLVVYKDPNQIFSYISFIKNYNPKQYVKPGSYGNPLIHAEHLAVPTVVETWIRDPGCFDKLLDTYLPHHMNFAVRVEFQIFDEFYNFIRNIALPNLNEAVDLPKPVILKYTILAVSENTFTRRYEIFYSNFETRLAVVLVTLCVVDGNTRRKTQIPQAFRDKYCSSLKKSDFKKIQQPQVAREHLMFEQEVVEQNIDHYGHCNLSVYFEMLTQATEKLSGLKLTQLPQSPNHEPLKNKEHVAKIRNATIVPRKECLLGDVVRCFCFKNQDSRSCYTFVGQNSENICVVGKIETDTDTVTSKL